QRKLAGRPLGYWSKTSSGTTILLTRPGEPRLRGKRATLGGYPGDKPDGEQWGAKGQIVSTTPAAGRELFYYTMDSCAGHSGSPVWIRRGTKIGLVGIHTGSCIPGTDCREVGPSKCRNTPTRRETTSNRAVLITPQLWTRVRGWM
ncbi:MAG: serine protease, partial [Limisphaerales bacterium]